MMFHFKEGDVGTHIPICNVQVIGRSGTLEKRVRAIPCSVTFYLC